MLPCRNEKGRLPKPPFTTLHCSGGGALGCLARASNRHEACQRDPAAARLHRFVKSGKSTPRGNMMSASGFSPPRPGPNGHRRRRAANEEARLNRRELQFFRMTAFALALFPIRERGFVEQIFGHDHFDAELTKEYCSFVAKILAQGMRVRSSGPRGHGSDL
jgi:hypothetical protein